MYISTIINIINDNLEQIASNYLIEFTTLDDIEYTMSIYNENNELSPCIGALNLELYLVARSMYSPNRLIAFWDNLRNKTLQYKLYSSLSEFFLNTEIFVELLTLRGSTEVINVTVAALSKEALKEFCKKLDTFVNNLLKVK